MRLLLLLLTGCRAGDHDLFLDRAYWARRLPLMLTENGSANDFGRCGRRFGFDACKCYAPSLDTVEALATASLAWTQDASRLAAAIARMQSHCEEAVSVQMPVWGLGGSLIAHLDEYVIPAWARGRAAALAARPYVRDGAEINFRRATPSTRCCFLKCVCSMAWRSTEVCASLRISLTHRRRATRTRRRSSGPPRTTRCPVQRGTAATGTHCRPATGGGASSCGGMRSGAGAWAASSGAGADCCLEVPFWSIGGVLHKHCAIKLSKACGRSSTPTHRAASPST